jgi:hypothetical protein
MYEIRHYLTASGKNLFEEWLDSLLNEGAGNHEKQGQYFAR